MTAFDERKDAFENRFALDQELRFKATARRNKLFGLSAAERLGKTGAEADALRSRSSWRISRKPGTRTSCAR